MLALLLAVAIAQGPAPIERDSYGVPHIFASTWEDAFYYAGYSVAEDRLWQMENSRRVARGRMAEAFGKNFAASDRDVLKFGYTDEDLKKQYDALPTRIKTAFEGYAKGVNDWIAKSKADGKLPPGYAQNILSPEPWTALDSAAIAVRLFQLFGRRDPGELRNWAFYLYLQGQARAKDKSLDILDDFLFQNDPSSPTTVRPEDDPLSSNPPRFPRLTREITEKHLASLPKLGLFDLLPALRITQNESQTRVAMSVAAPYKGGSYAIVVGKERSATGIPILLSAPQMGFTYPSIVHEMSIVGPGISASGMDVPGVPGVVIGYTPHMAWALTSGVADTDDVFYFAAVGDGYEFGSEKRAFQTVTQTLKPKDGPAETVEQKRTIWGPVILTAKGVHFARRSASWMSELSSMEALFGIYDARKPEDLDRRLDKATVNFNFHYAFNEGPIGYRYLGRVPMPAEGHDPRFPVLGTPENDWKGYVPFAQLPRVDNPKGGLIVNWNNKPASWFPNGDTPVWGKFFRVGVLEKPLDKSKLSVQDVEMAIWQLARTELAQPNRSEYTSQTMMPMIRQALDKSEISPLEKDALAYLRAYDGRALDGSQGAAIYDAFLDALREEVFVPIVGTLMTPQLFRSATQIALAHSALLGTTNVRYLGDRKADEVIIAAFKKAVAKLQGFRGSDPGLWTYAAGGIAVEGEIPIPYGNRGTYIQIIESRAIPRGRSVLSPGVSESGPHAKDQVPLSRAWTYKPMRMRPMESKPPVSGTSGLPQRSD